MAACEWRTWQGVDKLWYWGCNKQQTGGPYDTQQKAVLGALAHGEC